MKDDGHGIRVKLEGPDVKQPEQTFDRVLVSVGRKPNSGDLGLETTKAQIDAKGFIEVDNQRRTAEPSIFAIGDVAGEPMLAHKATHEGRVAVEAISGKEIRFRAARHSGRGLHRSGNRLVRADGIPSRAR